MTVKKKATAVEALNVLQVDDDCSPVRDLERLVQRPRNSAIKHSSTVARMWAGHVLMGIDASDEDLWMDVDGEFMPVQVADSCLLQVHVGDLVHAVLANGVLWVLSVLKKNQTHEGAARHLDFGESELHISARKICMSANQHIDIHAPLLTQTAKNRQSHIDGTDSAHVSNSLLHADGHLSLHAHSAMVTATSLLKVDGAQIHMG